MVQSLVMPKPLPLIAPIRMSCVNEPFDGREWIFEPQIDGFRALAYIEQGGCRLISRNGHELRGFRGLCASVLGEIKTGNAILDGELC